MFKSIMAILIFISFLLMSSDLNANLLNKERVNMNEVDKKIKFLENNLEKNPNSIIVRNNLAFFYEKKGEYKKAFDHYQIVLRKDKDYVSALYGSGNILFKLGRLNEAIVFYNDLVKVNKKFWRGYHGLAISYLAKMDYAKAAGKFEKLVKIKPSFIDSYYFLAKCYDSLRLYKKAMRKYKEFVIFVSRKRNTITSTYLNFVNEAKRRIKEIKKMKGINV